MSLSELGQLIKARRNILRITQPDLAEMAGISVNTLYKIERGHANPTVMILNKLAQVLGMELSMAVMRPTF